MDWVKLATTYYLDPAIMRAGEDAEVLFARGLAYAGDQETDGVIPAEALDRLTPRKARQRVAALVREGLWTEIEGGWRITNWHGWQTTADQIEARRESGRNRVAKHRAKRRAETVSNAVTNADVTKESRGRGREETAAAAADTTAAAAASADTGQDNLPATVAILRQKLQAHTALRALRFDLRPDQLDAIEHLVALHGDQPLVDVAVRTCRTTPPVSAAAFIGTWQALPEPGQRLAVVQSWCDNPHHDQKPLTAAGICTACVTEQHERASL